MTVAFTSAATNLVAGPDRNGSQSDIYLWRLESSTITRVSVDSNGVQPSIGSSYSPSVSRDGELVAFVSTARLAAEDTNDVADVYIRDLQRGVTSLVSAGVGKTFRRPELLAAAERRWSIRRIRVQVGQFRAERSQSGE